MSEHTELAVVHHGTPAIDWATLERVVLHGDLSKLSAEDRLSYYKTVCTSLGLNPATQPFDYIAFPKGGTKLYAKREASEQLRKLNRVSITKIEKYRDDDLYIVTAYAATADGRTDVDEGVVSLKGLSGVDLANAYKKAITQAKRRVTLSICGLGFLDESEVEDVAGAIVGEPVVVERSPAPSKTTREKPNRAPHAQASRADVEAVYQESTAAGWTHGDLIAWMRRANVPDVLASGIKAMPNLTNDQVSALRREVVNGKPPTAAGPDDEFEFTDEQMGL